MLECDMEMELIHLQNFVIITNPEYIGGISVFCVPSIDSEKKYAYYDA
jgi:hypothetical protein